MANIPIPSGIPDRATQRRPLTRPAARTVPLRATADMFNALSTQGTAWFNLIKTNEANNQLAEARATTIKFGSDYNQWVRENPGTPDTDLSEFNRRLKGHQKTTDAILTNQAGKDSYNNWFQQRQAVLADSAMENAFNLNRENEHEKFSLGLTQLLREPVGELDDKAFDAHLSDIDNLYEQAFESGILSPGEEEALDDSIVAAKTEQWMDREEARLSELSDEEFDRQIGTMPEGLKTFAKEENIDLRKDWNKRARTAKTQREWERTLGQQGRSDALYQSAKALPESEGFSLINEAGDTKPSTRNDAKSRLTEFHKLRRLENAKTLNVSLAPGATIQSLSDAIVALDDNPNLEPGERLSQFNQLNARRQEIDEGVNVFTPSRTKSTLHANALSLARATEEDREVFKARINLMASNVDEDGKSKTREIGSSTRDSVIDTLDTEYKKLENVAISDAISSGSQVVQDAFGGFASLVELSQALKDAGADEDERNRAILELERKNELQGDLYDRYIQDIRTLGRDEDLDPKTFAGRARVIEAHYRRLARQGVEAMDAERAIFESGLSPEKQEEAVSLIEGGMTGEEAIQTVNTPLADRVFDLAPPRNIGIGTTLKRGILDPASKAIGALGRIGTGEASGPGSSGTPGKPVRKGPIRTPDFKFTSPGKPEQVFDEDGKETGLRRADGSVFKVGSRMTRSGKVFEYVGNDEWKEIK